MSYIGNAPASFFTAVTSDVFSANGTANTFTLSKSISNLADIEVVVDNIQQNPFSGSYSVSGSSLTFSSTPSAGSNNIVVTYRQATIGSSIPTPNTVSNSSLQSNLLLTGNTSLGNTIITGTANVSTSLNIGANVNLTTSTINVGNSTVNASIASTGITGPLTGTIGATTPNTGAFTTLSATGVATFAAGSNTAPAITTTGDTNTGIFFPAADTIAFAEGGAEAMRIDSSGQVGINTSSPSAPVTIQAASSGWAAKIYGNSALSNYGEIGFYKSDGATFVSGIYSADSSALRFRSIGQTIFAVGSSAGNSDTERMRIDSSGNVGIGVTPSAWGSTQRVIQIGTTGVIRARSDANLINIISNIYTDSGGTNKYIATDAASLYQQYQGAHDFYSAPSGTAGNTVTNTQVLSVNKGKTLALEGATSQTGTGITFPATQSASTDANTLDDYEEGSFTPTISTGITSPTYSTQSGFYTKIGNIYYWQIRLVVTGGTLNSSLLAIGGMPFTSSAGTGSNGVGLFSYVHPSIVNSTTTNTPTIYVPPVTALLEFYNTAGASFAGSALVSLPDFYIAGWTRT